MKLLYLLVPLAPLLGAILAGLFGKTIGRRGAHVVTIAGVAGFRASFMAALLSLEGFALRPGPNSGSWAGPSTPFQWSTDPLRGCAGR